MVRVLRGVVTNWHFSRSFRLIFLNTYGPYLPRSYLTEQPTLVQHISPAHYVHRIYQKHVYLNPSRSQHNAKTTMADPFQPKEHSSMNKRPKAQARRQDPLHQQTCPGQILPDLPPDGQTCGCLAGRSSAGNILPDGGRSATSRIRSACPVHCAGQISRPRNRVRPDLPARTECFFFVPYPYISEIRLEIQYIYSLFINRTPP